MGSLVLEELDGTELRRRFAASHVKRFYSRGTKQLEENGEPEESDGQEEDVEDELDNGDRWNGSEF